MHFNNYHTKLTALKKKGRQWPKLCQSYSYVAALEKYVSSHKINKKCYVGMSLTSCPCKQCCQPPVFVRISTENQITLRITEIPIIHLKK